MEFEKRQNVTEKEYLEMINKKTSALFKIAAENGAIAGGGTIEEVNALSTYGESLGLAFQIRDDYLDISSNEEILGKDIGNDIRNGKKTLIAVHSLNNSNDFEKKFLYDIFGNIEASEEDIRKVYDLFNSLGSVEYARDAAFRNSIMVFDEIQIIIRKYSLQNAILFNGKANTKSVLGKIFPILQKKGLSPKEIIPLVEKIVKEVNKISLNDQIKELEKIAPDLLVKEKKERDYSLPELPNAIYGKVVTRFPPEPNGYLHIGHAKAAVVDYEYAKKYDGKFILRFDDTNPLNADEKFYSAQKKDLEWLDIKWDEEYCTSNNLEKHYELAEKLINQDNAYICDCSPDDIKKNRSIKKNCKCRNNSTGENLDYWKNIISSSKDGMVLRLKGKMDSNNTAMRDPTLFRIIEFPHPLQGDKYRVWPTYDFAGAIEDSLSGVTHPFRTKEYELRDECYFYLLDLLKLRKPNLMEFARLSIRGMPVSKRKIKPLIDKNLVNGYDDIRLPTLMGLKKRGILAESIKKFVISQGISKVESIVSFSLVEAENRKILDPITKRYFFVSNPIEINVINAKKMEKYGSADSLCSTVFRLCGSFFCSA